MPLTGSMENVAEFGDLHEDQALREEPEELERDEGADLSAIVVSVQLPTSKPSARSKGSRLASSASSRSRGVASEAAPAPKASIRRGKAKPVEDVQQEVPTPEPQSKSVRGRRAPDQAVETVEPARELDKSTSKSSRTRRPATKEPVLGPVPAKSTGTSKSSRATRTKTVEEPLPDVEPIINSRSRSAASRSSRKAEVPEIVEVTDESKLKGRTRKVLGDSDEQSAAPAALEPMSKAGRGKKALASNILDDPKSAPSRRTRTLTADKENEEVEVAEKKSAKRMATKKAVEPVIVATRTRTRSRK